MYGRPERAAAACLVAAHLADPAAAERRDAENKTKQDKSVHRSGFGAKATQSTRGETAGRLMIDDERHGDTKALFTSPPNSKFLHTLSITSIFTHMYGTFNVGKRNN
jgi:hypothetical protein